MFSGAAIDRVVPSHDPAYRTTRGLVSGADTLGFLVARRAAPITEPRPATDSIVLLRVAATTGAADSIAALAGGATRVNAEFAGGTRPQRIRFTWPVLVVDEQEVLFPDGWLAIARLRPYRVDWRAPDGRWIRGAPLPFAEIALNDREKRAWRNREVTLGRREPPGDAEWATHLPPFLPSLPSAALIPAPDGTLLIARTPTADRPESRYDVVDRRARLIAQLVLRPNERLVSIGARGAYVVATSEDGLEFVRRHPWPPVDQAQQRR